MEKLIQKAQEFTYHSFQYAVPEEAMKVFEGEDYLLVAEQDQARIKFFWAVESLERLTDVIKYAMGELSPGEFMLEFVPPEAVQILEKVGFQVISEWTDFWLMDLKNAKLDFPLTVEIRLIEDGETDEAAAVTRSCAGVSREFTGESEEAVREWMNGPNQRIFVAIQDEQIVGVCMMATYDGSKGKVAWVREVAVHPEYQSRGVGRSLIKVGLKWGLSQGCEVSFLATDVENAHAIRLYEKLGYKKQTGRGQINMAGSLDNV